MAIAGLLLACAAELQEAPRGPHPYTYAATPVAVASEPPPAQIEDVPPSPGEGCVWADGYWKWSENTWVWSPGKWLHQQDDCYYADSFMTWVPSAEPHGTLYYTPGRWYRYENGDFCAPPPSCR